MDTSANNLTGWLESIPTFLEQLERHRHTDDLVLANRLCGRCDDYLSLLHALVARAEEEILAIGSDEDLNELISDIQGLAVSLTTLADHYHDWVLQLIDSESNDAVDVIAPQRVYHGGRGRPPYHIPQSQLEALIELRFTYEKIAKLLNVSTRTLQRRRMQYGLPPGRSYTDILDDELDDIIKGILQVRKVKNRQK
jgi:hypothetical protein